MVRQITTGVLVFATSALLAGQTSVGYERTDEQVIAGTIKAVAAFPTADGSLGVHLKLLTPDGIVSVHVGPSQYIADQNFWFFADEKVQVVGARVPHDDNAPFWAKEITKGSTVLVLRNDNGIPRWKPGADGTDGCGVMHLPVQLSTEY